MTESDHFDHAIEQLLADASPRTEVAHLSDEEVAMLQMAQVLRGSQSAPPRAEFVEQLHGRLFERGGRVSRRTAFLSGLSAMAAGLLAGLGIERFALNGGSSPAGAIPPLVLKNRGTWVHIANVADVPPGAVHPFTAGAISGFLINHNGDLRAMSRICTHMGCALTFQQQDQSLLCPCHGAEFTIHGKLRYGDNGYRYRIPDLPKIDVRVRGQKVEVFGA